jgi:predicted site-specific integrase-resolvase
MKTKLIEFETIGSEYAHKLKKDMGIDSIDDFLEYSLEEIHQKSNIDVQRLQQWTDVIDLFRIPDLSSREAELLYFADINSIRELSHRQSLRIFYKLREIDEDTHHIILQLPTFNKIERWIYYAKLMTKRIKFGQNIPIILLPMVQFDNASELKNFKIFTVEDFARKHKIISNLRKKINMSRKNYHKLLNFISYLKIAEIDVYFARLFQEGGIESPEEFLNMENSDILNQILPLQENEPSCLEKLTIETIEQIKTNIKEDN